MNLNDALELTKDENLESLGVINTVDDNLQIDKEEVKNSGESRALDNVINDISEMLEKNIGLEMDKIDVNESIWEKMSKSSVAEVVKVAAESVLKGVLKKQFGINFSTFNDMKDTWNAVMDGNLKEALKNGSDAAINNIPLLDGITKTTIKNIKNAVIDKTINSEKYEVINKQTKLLNRINSNCEKFDEAMQKNDEKTMKSKINSITKDMKEILPIRETISRAQATLDKYSLWQNKGNEPLSTMENELIEKLNECA